MRMSMHLCVSDYEKDEDSLQLLHGIRPAFLAPLWACITRCLPISVFSSTAQDGHLLQREGTPACSFASAQSRSNNPQVNEACGDSSTRANDSTNAATAVVPLMQTHRKSSFDALLPTKEDPLAMQTRPQIDPLFAIQGDAKGDALAIIPDSLPRALRCLRRALAHVSPPSPKSKKENVRFIPITIFYPGQQIRSSRNSPKGKFCFRINPYPVRCVRCNLRDISPHATIIYPRNCRFSSPLWPFDPGIHVVQQSPSFNRPFAPDKRDAKSLESANIILLSFLEGGVYIKNHVQRKKQMFKARTLPPEYALAAADESVRDAADEPFKDLLSAK
ncbi:hypothetical protein KP509_07G062900 [Ceratopteris richardii]|uniref:Uncharacterized protein n=1 Tax=Ceratopteris richardii TaxID=49495 RepID=A0A8T2UBI8_CERRI|nr:hypothetical protein KP509_07G062900 [Ceratopteris richardii]